MISFSGKSLVMKERAYRAKIKNRDVVFISLASSDRFGQPLKYCGVYDLMTRREMNAQSIIFKTAQDLSNFVRDEKSSQSTTSTINPLESAQIKDNRKFVMEVFRKRKYDTEAYDILTNKNIDYVNAATFYNEQNKSSSTSTNKFQDDVYHSLKEFIKAYRDHDIYIDELLVLLSIISKFSL